MFHNLLKQNLNDAAHRASLGVFIGFPSTQLVEMAGYNGFDVVVIDNEHGMLSAENVEHMVIAAESAGVTPLVRVVSSEPTEILKAMDRGAHGVHVPQVNSKAEAERVVEAVKYTPMGKRGAAFSMRAARYGTIPIQEYLERANQESLICVHIESEQAMNNLQDILSVPGIDLAYIGPTDLSVSLGYGGDMNHPEVLKAIDEIHTTARGAGVKVGIHTKDRQGALNRVNWGADYVCCTITSLIKQSFTNFTGKGI